MSNETYNPAGGRLYDSNGNIFYLSTLLSNIASGNNDIIEKLGILENLNKTSFGRNGGLYVNDTSAHAAPAGKVIVAIIPIEEIVLTTVGNITITGVTFPQSYPIYGEYTSITLGSGSAIVYYGVS